jgi:pimeloyl-ACP methyl ester carboxylesterase
MSLPLINQTLGRLMMRNPTRDGNRKVWGVIQVAHPERLEDAFLDVDVAHTRRNLDAILSVICCVGRGLRSGQLVLGDRWQTLKVPTLFLEAERDVFIRPKFEKAMKAIVDGNPNVRLLRIPRAGHLPWLDEPELVVTEIERFLATQSRRGVGGFVEMHHA